MTNDEFVNTYFGRLEEAEDGTMLIDGIPANEYDPSKDPSLDLTKYHFKDNTNAGYNKLEKTVWNVGKFVLTASMSFTGVGGVAAAVIIGVADDLADEKKKEFRQKGGSRALYLLGRSQIEDLKIKEFMESKGLKDQSLSVVNMLKEMMRVGTRLPWETQTTGTEAIDELSSGDVFGFFSAAADVIFESGDSLKNYEYLDSISKTLSEMSAKDLRSLLGEESFDTYMFEKYGVKRNRVKKKSNFVNFVEGIFTKVVESNILASAAWSTLEYTNKAGQSLAELMADIGLPFANITNLEYDILRRWAGREFSPMRNAIAQDASDFIDDPTSYFDKLYSNLDNGQGPEELSKNELAQLVKTEKLFQARVDIFKNLSELNPNIRVDEINFSGLDREESDYEKLLFKDFVLEGTFTNFNEGDYRAEVRRQRKIFLEKKKLTDPAYFMKFSLDGQDITDQVYNAVYYKATYQALFINSEILLAQTGEDIVNSITNFFTGKKKKDSKSLIKKTGLEPTIDSDGVLKMIDLESGQDVTEMIRLYDYVSREFPHELRIKMDRNKNNESGAFTFTITGIAVNEHGQEVEVFNGDEEDGNPEFFDMIYFRDLYGDVKFDYGFEANGDFRATFKHRSLDVTSKFLLVEALKTDPRYAHLRFDFVQNGDITAFQQNGFLSNGDPNWMPVMGEKRLKELIGYDPETQTYEGETTRTEVPRDIPEPSDEDLEKIRVDGLERNEDVVEGEDNQVGGDGGGVTTIQNDVIDEEKQLNESKKDFEPTGVSLQVTVDKKTKKFSLQFEDGTVETYEGLKDEFKSSENGFWFGEIANASNVPINTLDNYFMAYHIELQMNVVEKNEIISRLQKRIQRSIEQKSISATFNSDEFYNAIQVLKLIRKYGNLSRLDIAISNPASGLGARIRDQILDVMDPPFKGVLPKWAKISKDYEIKDNPSRCILSAANLANDIGDVSLSRKFATIESQSQTYEKVAREYLESARQFKRANETKYIPNGFDRLILDQVVDTEDRFDVYARHIGNLLQKPLGEILNRNKKQTTAA
jgi:hypothetical protein